MNSESEPSEIEEKNTNPSISLFSLPDDIITNCIARISTSYYPKLFLVSKTFGALLSSYELYAARFLQKTHEEILHVCLQFSNNSRRPSWFSLWLKPNQTLTNDLEKKEKSTGNAVLVPIPSSYCPRFPTFMCTVGSESYLIINQNCYRSSNMSVTKSRFHQGWCKVPNMTAARGEDAIACVLDGKIYVMGGFSNNESKNWAEVYDTKTQTWESLPDPGVQLRFSTLMKMEVHGKIIYVKNIRNKNLYYDLYDTIEGRWNVVVLPPMFERSAVIKNVRYIYSMYNGFLWYSEKHNGWRKVIGLIALEKHCRGASGKVEMANYGGKLLMIWETFVIETNIWCALVGFERRNGDEEVWGKVEWASSVLTVPNSCVLLRHVIQSV